MQRKSTALIFLTLVLAGCATTNGASQPLAVTGRVEGVQIIEAAQRSPGAYRPGMGGAVGGLVAGIITTIGGTPAHKEYTLRLHNDRIETVPTELELDLPLGTCVDVFAPPKARSAYWKLGQVTIKPSNGCEGIAVQ